nr:hypothetical protein GCM10017611_56550 [Rhodococcus wratislaviensis]
MRIGATVASDTTSDVRAAATAATPAAGSTSRSHQVACATDIGVTRTASARGDDLTIRQLTRPGANVGGTASATCPVGAGPTAVVSGLAVAVATVAADLDVQRVPRGNRQLSRCDGRGAAQNWVIAFRAVSATSARCRHRQAGNALGNRERLRTAGKCERAGHLGAGALHTAGRQRRRRGNRHVGGEQPRGTHYGEATHSGRVPPAA